MFDLAVNSDDSGFAIGFDRVAAASEGDHPVGHHFAEDRAIGLNFGLQVFDVAASPRVAHHSGHREHPPRFVGGAEAFDQNLFVIGHDFTDFGQHSVLLFVALPLSGAAIFLTNEVIQRLGITNTNGLLLSWLNPFLP